jgi:hypothetical protein
MIDMARYAFIGVSDARLSVSISIVSLLFISLFIITTHLFKIGYKIKD